MKRRGLLVVGFLSVILLAGFVSAGFVGEVFGNSIGNNIGDWIDDFFGFGDDEVLKGELGSSGLGGLECGNGVCDVGENFNNCIADCGGGLVERVCTGGLYELEKILVGETKVINGLEINLVSSGSSETDADRMYFAELEIDSEKVFLSNNYKIENGIFEDVVVGGQKFRLNLRSTTDEYAFVKVGCHLPLEENSDFVGRVDESFIVGAKASLVPAGYLLPHYKDFHPVQISSNLRGGNVIKISNLEGSMTYNNRDYTACDGQIFIAILEGEDPRANPSRQFKYNYVSDDFVISVHNIDEFSEGVIVPDFGRRAYAYFVDSQPNNNYGECTFDVSIEGEFDCIDSDGKDVNNVGTAMDRNRVVEDECNGVSNDFVYESYCFANRVIYENMQCEYQCSKDGYGAHVGKCAGDGLDLLCVDSDGGSDYFVKGTVSAGENSKEDYCRDDVSLNEVSCLDNFFNDEIYNCLSGCENGKCNEDGFFETTDLREYKDIKVNFWSNPHMTYVSALSHYIDGRHTLRFENIRNLDGLNCAAVLYVNLNDYDDNLVFSGKMTDYVNGIKVPLEDDHRGKILVVEVGETGPLKKMCMFDMVIEGPIRCTEDDDGFDEDEKGQIRYFYQGSFWGGWGAGWMNKEDYCVGDELAEFACVNFHPNDNSFEKLVSCEFGCNDGKCSQEEEVECLDSDNDGYDNCESEEVSGDGRELDCDDNSDVVYPGASESCDGLDNNCDELIDEGGPSLCNDGILCTNNICSGFAGCLFIENHNLCDDELYCNGDEVCSIANDGCTRRIRAACDDGVACSEDFCNEDTDSCDVDLSTCDCPSGLDSECDDSLYCNGQEFCDANSLSCVSGEDVACNDGLSCTFDSCDDNLGQCVYGECYCESVVYSEWGDCGPDGKETRTIISQTPSSCVIEDPLLERACDYIPPCTDDDWEFDLSPLLCPVEGKQTKTWNKIGQCEGGVQYPVSLEVDCDYEVPVCTEVVYSEWGECQEDNIRTRDIISKTPAGCQANYLLSEQCVFIPDCSEDNWVFDLSPLICPVDELQYKTWSKIGSCKNGVQHPETEEIDCDYLVPVCETIEFSEWSLCGVSGVQTREVVSSSPSGCDVGNPLLESSCTYVPVCTPNQIVECGPVNNGQYEGYRDKCDALGEGLIGENTCTLVCDEGYVVDGDRCIAEEVVNDYAVALSIADLDSEVVDGMNVVKDSNDGRILFSVEGSDSLDLDNILIIRSSLSETQEYLIVNNLDLDGRKKSVRFEKKSMDSNGVCINDVDGLSLVDDIVNECIKVSCPSEGTYSCEVEGNVFIVSGLSNSGVVEDNLYCGDGECIGAESCSSCSQDCGSCPVQGGGSGGSSGGGGSGGGGSGGGGSGSSGGSGSGSGEDNLSVEIGDDGCDEKWSCNDWSECVNGEQTRICSDLNSCEISERMPSSVQNCGVKSKEAYDIKKVPRETVIYLSVLLLLVLFILIVSYYIVKVLKRRGNRNARLSRRSYDGHQV
tara:strand:+ start:2236 stop:6699 length:4464 start_codon:yes stop_codon:yes gene_type:complete